MGKLNCDKYLKRGTDRKCFDKLVADSCQAICKKELCKCEDREGEFTLKILGLGLGLGLKTSCTEIEERGLCIVDALSNICPVSCGAECLAATPAPSSFPFFISQPSV